MTVLLAGDSTVAPPVPVEAPLSGWGGYLHEVVTDDVANHAIGGATLASFVAEGRWAALLAEVGAGDTVVIQFGHNDQKDRPLGDALAAYRARLTQFVGDVRDRGAHPVLATSPERRLLTDDGLRFSHGAFPQAVRDVGHDLDVPVVDLTTFTRWLYTWLGPERSEELFVHLAPGESEHWPDGVHDNTHFSTFGARTVAAYVAECLAAIAGVGADLEPAGRWGMQP